MLEWRGHPRALPYTLSPFSSSASNIVDEDSALGLRSPRSTKSTTVRAGGGGGVADRSHV